MALMGIMTVMMSVAVPSWRYVVKNMREEELIFRGNQIAEAIERYQKKNGNAAPPSLQVLVEGRFLRKPYTDPMTKDGKWRLVRPGEAIPAPGVPGASPPPAPPAPAGGPGASLGGIVGVASRSKEKSLRIFNGRTQYSEWIFAAGQPRLVGADRGPRLPAPRLPGASPAAPSPRPGPQRQETRFDGLPGSYSLLSGVGGSGLAGRVAGGDGNTITGEGAKGEYGKALAGGTGPGCTSSGSGCGGRASGGGPSSSSSLTSGSSASAASSTSSGGGIFSGMKERIAGGGAGAAERAPEPPADVTTSRVSTLVPVASRRVA